MTNETNLEDRIVEKLREVFDPEIPVNIYDLGLIYEVKVNEEMEAHVLMTLTSPSCPASGMLPNDVECKVNEIEEIKSTEVEITFDPPWDQAMMSDEARLELGFM